jgi:hypothetical protein
MKMVKSLLLGAAAGMVAVAGAQAADLPVKAKPVQYVKICSLYGAGFYYMPGTDTCIKIGGFLRAEMNFNANGSFNPFKVADLDSRGLNFETTRARGVATFDVRSQTEYGTLRSYMAIGEQVTNSDGGSGVDTYSHRIFIQWAGFTAGLAVSFFDFYSTPKYSNTTNVLGSDTGGSGIPVFAYTAQLGGGFSATISAEDTSVRRTDIIDAAGLNAYAGRQWPDIVANLRIDQAWGSAQIMGAAHQVRTVGLPLGGEEFDDVGYAVGAGVKLNLPWGKGDSVTAQVAWAKGALKYVGGGLGTFDISRGGAADEGVGPAFDAVVTNGGTDLDLTEGWSVVAGADHHWNSQWKTSLYGTYGEILYSDAASTAVAALPAFGVAGATDGDWKFWQVGSRTVWSPVRNLDLSVDVMYNHLNTAFAAEGFQDQGWWQGMFRVQRNFYP